MFNLNLVLNYSISTSSYKPLSIAGFNNQLLIGTVNGSILVIFNNLIIDVYNGCASSPTWLYWISIDQFNYMAISCLTPYAYLYNMTLYTGKSISTNVYQNTFIGFDSHSQLVIQSWTQIRIYY